MRDTIKNSTYFDVFIKRLNSSNLLQVSKLHRNEVREDRIYSVKRGISQSYMRLLKAKYSRGDNMSSPEVYLEFKNALSFFSDSWRENFGKYPFKISGEFHYLDQYIFSTYLDILDMLSLGILLEVPEEDIRLIADYIDRDNVKDFLFEFLINYRIKKRNIINEESYSKIFHINERYGMLKEILNDDNPTAQEKLKHFLEKKWYQGLKGTSLYEQHKNVHDTYSGYWCFIAAAIVKIKNLDDSSFKNNQYYPKDLVN